MTFPDRLAAAVEACGNTACVGIGPHLDRLPAALAQGVTDRSGWAAAATLFGLGVIDAVAGVVPAVKPQVAFFEALGPPGATALETVVAAARDRGLIVILDAKRGDIGSTAQAYARATLDRQGLGADAVTLSPYLGPESLAPFADRCPDSGLFVLLRTSNPGAGAWQGEDTGIASRVAAWVADRNAECPAGDLGPVGVVVGATIDPREATRWRQQLPRAWFLVPGVGAQGATPDVVKAHARPDGTGALVVSARGVIFAKQGREGMDWRQAIAHRAAALGAAVATALR